MTLITETTCSQRNFNPPVALTQISHLIQKSSSNDLWDQEERLLQRNWNRKNIYLSCLCIVKSICISQKYIMYQIYSFSLFLSSFLPLLNICKSIYYQNIAAYNKYYRYELTILTIKCVLRVVDIDTLKQTKFQKLDVSFSKEK